MRLIRWVYRFFCELILGCQHDNTSFPITRRGDVATRRGSTHVTCLDCGHRFEYDWKTMKRGRVVDEIPRPQVISESVSASEEDVIVS